MKAHKEKIFVILALFAIMFFSAYLRYEDFSSWQKRNDIFTYQGEYQMAEFDSYYYLKTTKDLQEGKYDSMDETRRIPQGAERPFFPPFHSLITWLLCWLTGIDRASMALFIPIIFSSFLVPVMFVFSRMLQLNKMASLMVSFFSAISLTYLYRTRIGVFDTDCLNVVFLMLNTYLFAQFGLIKDTKRYIYLGAGCISTFLFFITWNTATSVVIFSSIFPLMIAIVFFFETNSRFLKYSVLAFLIFISLYFFGPQLWSYALLLMGSTQDIFPIIGGISELEPVNFSEFVKKTAGNGLLVLCMLLGLLHLIWNQKKNMLFSAVPFIFAFLPFFSGNRFMIFSAPILALGMGSVIQFIFNKTAGLKPIIPYFISGFIALFGIGINYETITHKYAKPAVFDNKMVLDAIDRSTPKKANIWTEWDLGYQINYYLDRSTFSDGELGDIGDILYYTNVPLASDQIAFSANFMKFYSVQKGAMKHLYSAFLDEIKTINFLKEVLVLKPKEAKLLLEQKFKNKELPQTSTLKNVNDWILFLYPKQNKEVYLVLNQHMLQTVFWFKQGNLNLQTSETIGLPFYLQFYNLTSSGNTLSNQEINIDLQTGLANYMGNTQHSFKHILTYDGIRTYTKEYANQVGNVNSMGSTDTRFVFEWNTPLRFGAAMSQEMAKTTFNKLFLQNDSSSYFIPIELNTPFYQIWKVQGDTLER